MTQDNRPWKVEQLGSSPLPIQSDVKAKLDELNRHFENRSRWRKLCDWWLYPQGHALMATDESRFTIDQRLLYKIHQQQLHDSARSHQLAMVTWLLVVISSITLIVVLVK